MIGDRWMECFSGGVNRMVCGGSWVVDGLGWVGFEFGLVGLDWV